MLNYVFEFNDYLTRSVHLQFGANSVSDIVKMQQIFLTEISR